MSVVVGVRKEGRLVLAADSLITFGSARMPEDNLKAEKIRALGDSLFASAGWGLYDDIIEDHVSQHPEVRLADEKAIFSFFLGLWRQLHERYSFVNDQPGDDKDSPFGDLDTTFLIANRGGLFHVGSDMSVTRFRQYYAIGSGGDYALGALHVLYRQLDDPAAVARGAVEAAVAFDTKCGGPILVREVECASS